MYAQHISLCLLNFFSLLFVKETAKIQIFGKKEEKKKGNDFLYTYICLNRGAQYINATYHSIFAA